MKSRWIGLTGFLIACFAFSQDEATVSIRGRVLFGADKSPVVGAEVGLWDSCRNCKVKKSILTNEEGRFELTGTKDQAYRLLARMEGFYPALRYIGKAQANPEKHEYELILRPRFKAQFAVVDPEGNPIPEAKVANTFYRVHVLTDKNGKAEMIVPQGQFALQVSAPYFTLEEEELFSSKRQPDLTTIVLQPAGRISGTVTDSEGNALAGIQAIHTGRNQTLSDKVGAFSLDHLPLGKKVRINFRDKKDAYTFEQVEKTIRQKNNPGLAVVLKRLEETIFRSEAVLIEVVDEQGNPIQHATATTARHRELVAHMDENGTAELKINFKDKRDMVEITVNAENHQSSSTHVSIDEEGEVVDSIQVTLRKGEWLQGRIIDPYGEPVGNLPLRVTTQGTQGRIHQDATTKTDRNGYFHLTTLNRYAIISLDSHLSDYSSFKYRTEHLNRDDLVISVLPTTTAKLRVVDEQSGQPVTDFAVAHWTEMYQSFSFEREKLPLDQVVTQQNYLYPRWRTVSHPTGILVLPHLVPTTQYRVFIKSLHDETIGFIGDLVPNPAGGDVEIYLTQNFPTKRLKVVDQRGEPIEGVVVTSIVDGRQVDFRPDMSNRERTDSNMSPTKYAASKTGTDGQSSIFFLDDRIHHSFILEKEGYTPKGKAWTLGQVPEEVQTVVLEETGSVVFRMDPNQFPKARLAQIFMHEDDTEQSSFHNHEFDVDLTGTEQEFTIPNLPAGFYSIALTYNVDTRFDSRSIIYKKRFKTEPGQHLVVELGQDLDGSISGTISIGGQEVNGGTVLLSQMSRIVARCPVMENGVFQFEGLQKGAYVLHFSPEPVQEEITQVQLHQLAYKKDIELGVSTQLSLNFPFSSTIQGALGDPVDYKTTVTLMDWNRFPPIGTTVELKPGESSFELKGLLPGTYSMLVQRHDENDSSGSVWQRGIAVGKKEQTIDLGMVQKPTAKIEVVYNVPDSDPSRNQTDWFMNAFCTLLDRQDQTMQALFVTQDIEGDHILEAILPGEYQLVYKVGNYIHFKEVRIEDSETIQVVIDETKPHFLRYIHLKSPQKVESCQLRNMTTDQVLQCELQEAFSPYGSIGLELYKDGCNLIEGKQIMTVNLENGHWEILARTQNGQELSGEFQVKDLEMPGDNSFTVELK